MQLLINRRFSRQFTAIFAVLALALLLILFSACGSNPPVQPTPTVTLTATPTFPPTLTPTPEPLGSTQNPFVIGLVSETGDPQVKAAGDTLAQKLWDASGLNAVAVVYPSYSALVDGLAAKKVHITWLPPLTYLYASETGLADVVLLTNHFGVYQYGSQFLANVESEFEPFYDPISGMSSTDATTALQQFQDLRPCWVDPESASGYIVPAGSMESNGYTTLPAVWTQSHTATVRALYIKDICDFGATFAISGDPRTASAVQDDLPDVMNRILIIWQSEAIIPNWNLSLISGLPESNRQLITEAFLEIAKTSEGKSILTLSAGNYQIEDLQPANDELYNPLREMVDVLDLEVREMIGK